MERVRGGDSHLVRERHKFGALLLPVCLMVDEHVVNAAVSAPGLGPGGKTDRVNAGGRGVFYLNIIPHCAELKNTREKLVTHIVPVGR